MSRSLLLAAVCSPVLIALVLQTAIPVIGTSAWAAGATAIAGCVLVLVGAYGVVRGRLRRPGVRSIEFDRKAHAARVRFSGEVFVLRLVAIAMTAMFFGSLGLVALHNSVVPVGVLLFGVGLGFLGWLVVRVVRGVRVGELVVGPTELTIRSDGRDLSARWDDVYWLRTWDATQRGATWRRIDIGAREVRGWTEPGHKWWAVPRSSMPSIEVRCDLIDVDAVLLHDWLKFYVDNPAARVELGTPASLARAQALALAGRGGSLGD